MNLPDLVQRIYFEKKKGNDGNFQKVFNELRAHDFEFILDFEFENRKIYWTCFESKRYYSIIKEADEYIYFYLWDSKLEFEIIIPGHTWKDELNKPILERTAFFHSIWIIGKYFPGLDEVPERPLQIYLQHIRRMYHDKTIRKLNYWFKKMLSQYQNLKQPIFEALDYDKSVTGKRLWKKLVEKKK